MNRRCTDGDLEIAAPWEKNSLSHWERVGEGALNPFAALTLQRVNIHREVLDLFLNVVDKARGAGAVHDAMIER